MQEPNVRFDEEPAPSLFDCFQTNDPAYPPIAAHRRALEGESACPEDTGWLCLAVLDTGTGMTEEVEAHVFEPFFTTKAAGEGTGLGLAQVYGIVKRHGGHVDLETEVGEESTFHVCLPAHEAKGNVGGERGEDAKLPRGQSDTILLAEDDRGVGKAIREMLASLGYRVLTAADDEEALDLHRLTG